MSTQRFTDGSAWQALAGYSRAVRSGDVIAVSGTTASSPDGEARHPGDTYAQTLDCLDRVIAAVEALGGRDTDIVRTRMLLTPQADWREAARAHAERLGAVAPANSTYVVHALVGEGLLVEVEADAVVSA